MSILTFKGGVHPYDGKELSKDVAVRKINPGKEVVIPVAQHIGAPAVPVVDIGDRVLKGQRIAEAEGFVSANVHSSISGTVKKIEKRLVPTGNKVLSIIIENDEKYEEMQYEADGEPWTKEFIRETVKDCGVVGLGGACFPTHVKLTPKNEDDIDYVIVNGAECEPYITSDYRRLVEQPKEVIEGLKIILRLFDHAKGVIAVENNKPDAIENLTKLTQNEDRIEIASLKTKYPQGSERHIIYAVTKRKINSSMLPADAGCIVDNVDTVVSIYEAVAEGKPLMQRIVTVTGDGVNIPSNFRAPVGMDFQELLDAAGGLKGTVEKVISGGPMMGFAMFDYHVPVTKTTSALLVLTKDEVSRSRATACINCGRCVSECPEHLLPTKLATFAEHRKEEAFVKYNGMECCECGCCSYVCPAKRPLVQEIRSMRKMVMANRKKK